MIPTEESIEIPEPQTHDQTVKEDIVETWKLLISPRMLRLTPLIIWTAVGSAINPTV